MNGYEPLIIVAAIVIVIIILSKISKHKNAIKDLYKSAGYLIAKDILNELAQKGFDVNNEMSISTFGNEGAVGTFNIDGVGKIYIAKYASDLYIFQSELRRDNFSRRYFAIHNNNIGLLVRSSVASDEIPPFIEIAANVIKNSGYEFKHPKYLYEHPDAFAYLNVMFHGV